MKLEFISFVDKEKTKEILEYDLSGNRIILKDDNKTTFVINKDHLIILRDGLVKQELKFREKEKTKTIYKDNLDFNLEFDIYTETLLVTSRGIFIKYNLVVDNDIISRHKIYLKFLEKSNKID